MNKWTLLLLILIIGTTESIAQKKKKISLAELDMINGLYYQRNTIGPYSGTAYEEHANGKKRLSVPIKEGKLNGLSRQWEKDGTKIYEAKYDKGVQIGMETQWYATGVKRLEIMYVSGQPEGVCTEWYRNKQKKSEGLFKQGKEEGLHQWWFPSGQLDQEVTYKIGKTQGLVKNWYQTGELKLESNFVDGQRSGKTTKWFASGQKKSEEDFVEDKQDGESYFWNKKGIIQAIRIYKEGRLIQEKNYRSGSINIGNGYVQVYNELESFFQVSITGEKVRPLDDTEVAYVIDGMLLKMYNIRWKDFLDTTRVAQSDKELLERYLGYEKDMVQQADTTFQFDIRPEWSTIADDKTILFWSFKAPSSLNEEQKPRTVQEEYYMSIICNQQILTLYSPRTNSDDPKRIRGLLQRLIETTRIKEERIDLNMLLPN